jgi:PAS domain S-box-containing protein
VTERIHAAHGAPAEAGLRPLSEFGLDDQQIWGVVDAAPDGMVMVDEEGTILLVNRQTEELFGYERSELLGRQLEELLPEQLRQVHRAHRTRYRVQPRTRSMGASMTLAGRRRDGTEFPVEVSLSPLESDSGLRVVAAVRDVSERLKAEAEVRRVQEIVDAIRDGVFIFDRVTLRYSYVNQGALTQVGYTREELLGMTPLHIAPEFSEADFRELLVPVAAGEVPSVTFTTMHRRRDGVDVPVEVLVQAPVTGSTSDGESFVALVRDVSERVETQDRLRRAAHELDLVEDRERIARDLHDLVIQRLFAAAMTLQATRSMIDDESVQKRMGAAIDELDETIREIRTVIFGLQPGAERQSGLRGEILRIVSDERYVLGFEPRVHLDGPIDAVADEIGEHLCAALREALSNVARHAQASSADVSVLARDELVLRVADNGVGMAPQPPRGQGLRNMSQRAERLGGSFHAAFGTDGGTVVEWSVPNR